jgi:predicted PurR-regulated permease PerM
VDEHYDSIEIEREQHTALGWAALVAVVVILWLVMPVGVGILLGAFMAFIAQPLFERMRGRVGGRWAGVATVLGSGLALAVCIGGLGWLFVARGTTLGNALIDSFKPNGAGTIALGRVAHLTAKFGVSSADLEQHAQKLAAEAASRAATIAESIAATTSSALLGLFFAMLAMHYILCNWSNVARRAQETFPLRPEYTAALFAEFREVGRTTLLGAVGTGIAQGVFATVGYAIGGVPEAVFFGAATTVASFVPAVGVLLVIVPVTLGLFLVDHPGSAVAELVFNLVFVVGVCDYVIRPRLVRGESRVPSIVTFTALFGGLEVFGLKGLILGPVMMALALAVLRLYGSEARRKRHLDQGGEGY